MSESRKDGGAAFPAVRFPGEFGGMSLRDFFAGHALAGAVAEAGTDTHDEIMVRRCYELADAMLKERAK